MSSRQDSVLEGGWTMVDPAVNLSEVWEAVGPFPSGMREHPLTASPLAAWPRQKHVDSDYDFATRPYDEEESFPSAMGLGGRVGWSHFKADPDGHVRLSYPDIKWDNLRRDHGWAALQHQCLLRTDLTVPNVGTMSTPLRVDLAQGTEYAFISSEADGKSPTVWHQGDVYDFASSPSGSRGRTSDQNSNFARSIDLKPGSYKVLVRAMYEIRMFGDPGHGQAPTIDMHFRVTLDDKGGPVEVVEGLRVVPDMVSGWMMGKYLSVPLRVKAGSASDAVIMQATATMGEADVRMVNNGSNITIRAGQTRPVVFLIDQKTPIRSKEVTLFVQFIVRHRGKQVSLDWRHPVLRRDLEDREPFLITFATPNEADLHGALISNACVVPPSRPSSADRPPPVMLGLHGAGVDIESPFWAKALPNVPGMWAVLPSGKNEWGEDWHGGSASDVFCARKTLSEVVTERLGVVISDRTLLVGHSNGGQGAWHLAARYPDAFVGVIAASGWLKIQDYVPYLHMMSNHYADPMLMGILNTALTPYNNDLYASNLTGLPVLAIHGEDDDNVPPRHSRQHVALSQAWKGDCKERLLVEVAKRGHWWDDVLKLPEVYDFIDKVSLAENRDWPGDREMGFTLTSANPDEGLGRSGVKIAALRQPGRLARLDVTKKAGRLDVKGTNVKRITYQSSPQAPSSSCDLSADGRTITAAAAESPPRRQGPMIRILDSAGPITIIVNRSQTQCRSVALRYAHDLFVYHRLIVDIVSDEEALAAPLKAQMRGTNVIMIGRPDQNRFVAHHLAHNSLPVSFNSPGQMIFGPHAIQDRGAGLITLLPNIDSTGLAILLAANDDDGLELAARLLPIRTGVPVPEWAIVSPRTRWQAAGGLIGSGWYDHDWKYSGQMSWMDRP